MKKLLSLGALLAALWSAQPAAAADNTVPPQLEKYVTSPAFREILASVLDKLPPEIFPHCPALKSPGAKLTPLQPIAFAKDGTPTSGAWKQSLPVSGCGNDTILNFIFAVSPDGKIHPIALAPGYTHAEPALQRDSVTYATVAAEKLAPDCVSWQVRHTPLPGLWTCQSPRPRSRREFAHAALVGNLDDGRLRPCGGCADRLHSAGGRYR